jgi:hypothetical protein
MDRRHSTIESGIPLWMPSACTTMPSHRVAPNQPQQFIMLCLVGEGSHNKEGGVHLHRRRVVPPSGFGCQVLQEGFVDGTNEEEEEPFYGMSCSL